MTGEIGVNHYTVGRPDGTRGCSWECLVRASALRRLGIEPPEIRELV
ncbi:hypothetical protein [Catellatospora tritici]|nr:hypothetical protein [Catellatospora tritici]MBV1856216.1 hypothetical protein [Catellatospora tritici]